MPAASTASARQGLGFIFDWAQDRALTVALLGPPGAGKSELLSTLAADAGQQGWRIVRIDFRDAREIWSDEDFYRWLLSAIKAQWPATAWKTPAPRADFTRLLEKALSRSTVPALLILDHLEELCDECARSLVANLREIQDSGLSKPAWSKLRCVLSGTVSVYRLRRRLNSPNLQFTLHVLPSWSDSSAVQSTRDFLAATERTADEAAIDLLARLTGGEHAFLEMVSRGLPGTVSPSDVENAVHYTLAAADQIRYLALPALTYLVDDDFRPIADRLLRNEPVQIPDGFEDISRYQLLGAIRLYDRRPHFRNGLIERVLTSIRNADPAVDRELAALTRLRCGALSGPPHCLLEDLAHTWKVIAGADPALTLYVRARNSPEWYAVSIAGVRIEDPPSATATPCGEPSEHALIRTCILRSNQTCFVESAWQGLDYDLSLTVKPGGGFSPNIACRVSASLWNSFLAQHGQRVLDVVLPALGRFLLSATVSRPKKIFVSSTFLDLAEYRAAIMEQIQRRDMFFRGMEYFGADSLSSKQVILKQVRESDVYLGIFGLRYGSLDPETGLSMTELEYDEAVRRNQPCLCYVADSDAEFPKRFFESDPDKLRKLNAFVAKVKKRNVYQFSSIEDLARQVYTDLGIPEKLVRSPAAQT